MPNYKRVFAKNHYIFITVVTYKRNPILIDNIELLRESFKTAKTYHSFEIFGMVVLKDHFHMIIKPDIVEEYPPIIALAKWHFSKNIDKKFISPVKHYFSPSKIKRNEKGVWQRRYYEHTIRNEESLYRHLDYIHYNPVKHGYVSRVKDWEYSSFHKFVKQRWYESAWGTFDDVKCIQDMNKE